ncbi:MAG TPA: pyruvate kinase alpha/beta domain-containing protein [Dehalococcoidia bacterium]|nr:pyruvate kinase alpha/beta domain-containing protein [Dehalococcoidia bacterium]
MEFNAKLSRITYFLKAGRENTEATFNLAAERANELGIKTLLLASTTGETGARAVEYFKGYKIIVVSHVHGFAEPNRGEMHAQYVNKIESAGGRIITAAHAFSGVSRAIRTKFEVYQTAEIMANTLKIFAQGIKVVCEIAMMAADAGMVRTDEEVIALAGSGRGADTAVVLMPANSHNFFDLKIKEIICKPRL